MSVTLAALLGGLVGSGARPPAIDCGDLVSDSRAVGPGDVFVALAGNRVHGLDYLEPARAAGALAVLYDPGQGRAPPQADDCFAVPGLAGRLPELARRRWGHPDRRMRLHGVTGTNGKSSCAWLLAGALDGGLIGTLGGGRPHALQPTSHTTPDLLTLYKRLSELAEAGIEDVALEVSSHALDQGRTAGLAFETVTLTNLSQDHFDYHADLHTYGQAKARLFRDHAWRRALLNVDDAFGRHMAAELSGQGEVWTFGAAASADVRIEVSRTDVTGSEVHLFSPGGRVVCNSQLLGAFNAYNLAVVAGVLCHLGVSTDATGRRLSGLEPVPGRMNRLPGGADRPDVIIDYAHSPDALEHVLTALAALTAGEIWCVFGCGGERDRGKRPKMGAIAEKGAHHVVLTDDNPRAEDGLAIIRDIQAGMARPHRARVIRDRAAAIRGAIAEAGAGDVVLVAGKGHETRQIVGDRNLPFSDFGVARQALEMAA